MGWQLKREEQLDGERLRAMLEENPARAAQAILGAAGQGVIEAQALLGQILLDGRGIQRDAPLALRWFDIAAHNGHAMARNMLGRCHEHGWGCPADARRAAAHYRLAANAGLDWGLYNYGNLLATGRGTAVDQAAALACYRQAAELGHAKSMNLYGRYLEQGIAIPEDRQAAYDWYKRSAQAGDFRGQFSFATALFEAGRVEQALHWFEQALANGNLNFMRVSTPMLEQLGDVRLGGLAQAYRVRLEQLVQEAA